MGVDGRVIKGIDRAQAGDALAGIQAGAVGRAVQIDHITRMRGYEDGSPQVFGKRIQPLHVPVGVGHLAGLVGKACRQRWRHISAGMGHGDQQGLRALVKDE
ncbi:hypothetical protein D3C72_2318810 [compost metagenome]